MTRYRDCDGISDKIIGAAIEVHRVLGRACWKVPTRLAFAHELSKRGIPFRRQSKLPVLYKKENRSIAATASTYSCKKRSLLELKSVDKVPSVHEANWSLIFDWPTCPRSPAKFQRSSSEEGITRANTRFSPHLCALRGESAFLASLPTNARPHHPSARLAHPQDDGAAVHLNGSRLPPLAHQHKSGRSQNLAEITGKPPLLLPAQQRRPRPPAPDGWDLVPAPAAATPAPTAISPPDSPPLGVTIFGIGTQTTEYQREFWSVRTGLRIAQRLRPRPLRDEPADITNAPDLSGK